MGADLTFANRRNVGGEDVADVTARTSFLRGVEVPAVRAPSMIDEILSLQSRRPFAEGDTVIAAAWPSFGARKATGLLPSSPACARRGVTAATKAPR